MTSRDLTDAEFEFIGNWVIDVTMRAARGALLAGVATWLAATQTYVQYSAFQVGLVVFILGCLNKYSWIAGLLTAWLVLLVAAPPQLVSGLASAVRIAGH